MNFTAGLILIAVTIAMIVVARPADGVAAPFLKVWIVGQVYALIAMVSFHVERHHSDHPLASLNCAVLNAV